MAAKIYEFPDGKRFELDIENPEHRAWMEERAKTASPGLQAPAPAEPVMTPGKIIADLPSAGGRLLRAGVKGLASLPGLVFDPITALSNKVVGTQYPTVVGATENVLDRLGVSKPQTSGQRVADEMTSALAGSGGFLGTAQKLAPVMAQAPRTQLLSSALSSGAAGTVREAGGSPEAQIAAALAAGMAPAAGATVAEPLKRITGRITAPMTQAGRDAVKAQLVREAAGSKIDEVAQALANPATRIQGMDYDAGLAAVPAGSTEFSALARGLQARFRPSELQELERANAAARLTALEKIAGEGSEAAKGLRSSTAALTYPEAFAEKIRGNPALAKLFQNPYIRQAVAESADLTAAQKLTPQDNLLKILQNVKFGLDKMLAGQGKTVLGAAEQREALQAQKALVSWMEQASPKYQIARETFAQQSRPVNRAEVGEYLAQKLAAPLGEKERAGVFAQAVRDAPGTLKRATGNARYDDIAQVLLPRQVRDVRNVQRELEREAELASQIKAGSTRIQDITKETLATTEPPPFLHRGVTALRAALERIEKGTSRKTLEELAVEMRSPEKIAELLRRVPPQDVPAVREVLKQIAAGAGAGTAIGAKE